MNNWNDPYMYRDKPAELNRQVFEELFESASGGDATSQFRLGCCYFHGWITERNYRLAFELFTKANEQGHALATHKIGNCYYLKKHVKVQDIPKAFEFWKKAAEKGVAASFHNMGMANYYNLKDYERAIEFYTKAAEKGFIMSHLALANIYKQGKGVKRDIQIACDWYAKAAELGSMEAQDRLFKILYPKRSKKSPVKEDESIYIENIDEIIGQSREAYTDESADENDNNNEDDNFYYEKL